LNGTLTLGNIYALPASTNVFVSGVNSLLQCCDAAQIGGNVALNDGGSINLGNGSFIAGNLTVTSLVNGIETFNPCYWTGNGTVQGTVTVGSGGILTVGQDGPATLTTVGGMLVNDDGQVLAPDPGSSIVGSVDFEGSQNSTIVGGIQGTGNTLTVNCGQSNGVTGSVTLGQSAQSGASGMGTIGNVIVTNGTLIVMTPGSLADGANLAIGGSWTSAAPIVGSPGGPGQTRQPPATLGQGNDTGGGSTGSTEAHDIYFGRLAVDMNVLDAETKVLYPSASSFNDLTTPQQKGICFGVDFPTFQQAIANNGGTKANMTAAAVDAALSAFWANQGMTVTANNNTFDGGVPNPWNDDVIALRNLELAWYATHDIS
jgi:hypothetical protein